MCFREVVLRVGSAPESPGRLVGTQRAGPGKFALGGESAFLTSLQAVPIPEDHSPHFERDQFCSCPKCISFVLLGAKTAVYWFAVLFTELVSYLAFRNQTENSTGAGAMTFLPSACSCGLMARRPKNICWEERRVLFAAQPNSCVHFSC